MRVRSHGDPHRALPLLCHRHSQEVREMTINSSYVIFHSYEAGIRLDIIVASLPILLTIFASTLVIILSTRAFVAVVGRRRICSVNQHYFFVSYAYLSMPTLMKLFGGFYLYLFVYGY